jgi:hypothetical protein
VVNCYTSTLSVCKSYRGFREYLQVKKPESQPRSLDSRKIAGQRGLGKTEQDKEFSIPENVLS